MSNRRLRVGREMGVDVVANQNLGIMWKAVQGAGEHVRREQSGLLSALKTLSDAARADPSPSKQKPKVTRTAKKLG